MCVVTGTCPARSDRLRHRRSGRQLSTGLHADPYNLDFDYGPLEGLQKFCINNLGDPFIESNYGVHSREFEVCGMLGAWLAWQPVETRCRLTRMHADWGAALVCAPVGDRAGGLLGGEALLFSCRSEVMHVVYES